MGNKEIETRLDYADSNRCCLGNRDTDILTGLKILWKEKGSLNVTQQQILKQICSTVFRTIMHFKELKIEAKL